MNAEVYGLLFKNNYVNCWSRDCPLFLYANVTKCKWGLCCCCTVVLYCSFIRCTFTSFTSTISQNTVTVGTLWLQMCATCYICNIIIMIIMRHILPYHRLLLLVLWFFLFKGDYSIFNVRNDQRLSSAFIAEESNDTNHKTSVERVTSSAITSDTILRSSSTAVLLLIDFLDVHYRDRSLQMRAWMSSANLGHFPFFPVV